MRRPLADETGLRRLISAAEAAPSIHNTQPWRFRVPGEDIIELRGDPDRMLLVADPRGAGPAMAYRRSSLPPDPTRSWPQSAIGYIRVTSSSSAATSALPASSVAAGALTITTGQPARLTQARATGPAPGNVDAAEGAVAPSTSRSASTARSINTRATRPSASSVVTPAGMTGPSAVRTARVSRARAAVRSSPGLGRLAIVAYGASCRRVQSHTCTTRRAARRSPASPAAQRNAASDAAEPFTPTTIRRSGTASITASRLVATVAALPVPPRHQLRHLPALPPATLAFPACLRKGRKSPPCQVSRLCPQSQPAREGPY